MQTSFEQIHPEFLDRSRNAKHLLEIALDACKAEDNGLISSAERRELLVGLINEADVEITKAIRLIETRRAIAG